MPANARVIVKYGPYKAVGVLEHRESRLQGLQTILTKDGHKVELVQIDDWNCVELHVNGEEIFKCNINDLDYGSDGELDPLCRQAQEAVKKAY